MTASAIVKKGLENVFQSIWQYQFSLFALILTLICLIVGISTNTWIKSDSFQEGLWKTCSTDGNSTCCASIKDVPAFLGATRAFLIMTLLLVPVLIVMRCKGIYDEDEFSSIHIPTFIAVLFLVLVSSIYGGMYGDRNVPESKLSVSFGLCVAGMFLLIIQALAVCCARDELS